MKSLRLSVSRLLSAVALLSMPFVAMAQREY